AAALLVKLPYLNEWSASRRKNAEYYNKKFKDTGIGLPFISSDCQTIYNQYMIRVPNRDKVIGELKKENIGCEIYYPVPMHLQECFAYLGYKKGDFPEAEKAANNVLALPIYPELTDAMKDDVIAAVLKSIK
ncbi:MAG: DegT/DnrJ/EryC1/StrS family aminotransferase, partial [Phycisphaerales bacterium]